MATTTTPALGSPLGCQVWAGVDCTDTADTVVTTRGVPLLACSACAERHAEIAAPPQSDEPPF